MTKNICMCEKKLIFIRSNLTNDIIKERANFLNLKVLSNIFIVLVKKHLFISYAYSREHFWKTNVRNKYWIK